MMPLLKRAIIPSVFVFSGFASLFALQHSVKHALNIPDDESTQSHRFSYAVSTLYFGQLIGRFGHHFACACLGTKRRAIAGSLMMFLSVASLFIIQTMPKFQRISLVSVAYFTGGIGLGSFETNYVSQLSHLGRKTKLFGILGVPLGIFLVVVPGYGAIGLGLIRPAFVYFAVALGILLSSIVLATLPCPDQPVHEEESNDEAWSVQLAARNMEFSGRIGIIEALQDCRFWLKTVTRVGWVFMVNLVIVTCFSPGVLLYLYGDSVGLNWKIPRDLFFAIFSFFGCFADTWSRRIAYRITEQVKPDKFLLLTALGVLMVASLIPTIAPFGTFLVFMANGSIYAHSCRIIDKNVDRKFLLAANSVFFIMGDCGSILGSLMIPWVRDWLHK